MNVDVTTEIEIARHSDEVATFAMDPDNVPAWYANIQSVEWQTSRPVCMGSRVAFVAQFLGRRLAYTYEVVVLEPGRRLVMRTAEGPFPMETTYTFESVSVPEHAQPATTPRSGDQARPQATMRAGRTRMTLQNRGTPSGFSAWLAPFMSIAVRRATRKDLARLKAILERTASS